MLRSRLVSCPRPYGDKADLTRRTPGSLSRGSFHEPVPTHPRAVRLGGGRPRARTAQAVELALRELAPDAEVRNIDLLELTNAAFRRLYGKAYLDLVNRAPHLLGYFYDMMDKPRRPDSTRDWLRVALEKLNLGKFIKPAPRGAVGPGDQHALPARGDHRLAAQEGRDANCRQVTVTTDFETHRLWVNQPCEHYFTATDEGARYLHHWGVPAGRHDGHRHPHPPGLRQAEGPGRLPGAARPRQRPARRPPARGRLRRRADRAALRGTPAGEAADGAGRGRRPERRAARRTWRSAAARRATPHKVHVLGFTDQIDELMAAADLVVSKPGGLTTSEVLARGAAMVIVNPIPGQESRNSDFLLENGAAIKVNQAVDDGVQGRGAAGRPGRLGELRAQSARLGQPRAAYTVAQAALRHGRQARLNTPPRPPRCKILRFPCHTPWPGG